VKISLEGDKPPCASYFAAPVALIVRQLRDSSWRDQRPPASESRDNVLTIKCDRRGKI